MTTCKIIDFTVWRWQHEEKIRRAREDAFDRELSRRLQAVLRGERIPVTRIPDNPYADYAEYGD